MTLSADENGQISGRFFIPDNIPVGSKNVNFIGSGGSRGNATYTGSGTITTQTLRRVRTAVGWRFDPLAQTFTLPERRFVAGIELWFKKFGDKPVRVQIRETELGLPNETVLAESTLEVSNLKRNDEPTLFDFAPISLEANEEYAIVVLTDDALHEVAIAELGKFDQTHGWVTSQPYQVGVLLSSSNASTWTPHQKKDLTFRLKGAKFIETEQTVSLGQVALNQHSDLMAMAAVERPNSETQLHFSFSGEKTGQLTLQEGQAVQLSQLVSEPLQVSATLKGSHTQSPVLYNNLQTALGKVENQADYVTRAIPCIVGGSLKISFEAHLPGVARVEVWVEQNSQWVTVPQSDSQAQSDGYVLCHYVLGNVTNTQARVKLVLSGSNTDRPRIRSLRAFSS
ncbi:hypothetical protein CWB73_00935 [Pseudoalteromonas phenolica]|uniref:Uncharacterized protein n=1 Tax=Pseudoalteromonas phenolica TaxID=161398 RepID=A0A5S3YZM8_9GAMM|nr:hypothetical protein [Pseudoalteromonas phenolica]TMP83745.1 hypothetical protein CWB73_00935 [Pseudoalteromonas phenolica]